MICKNCNAKIRNRESYCPSCGMELLIPYSKSLKEKYMAGEYIDRQDDSILRDKRNNRTQESEYPNEKSADEYEQYYENEAQEHPETKKSGSSVIVVIILFLIVALLIGFVIGMIIFSGILHTLPSISNLTSP